MKKSNLACRFMITSLFFAVVVALPASAQVPELTITKIEVVGNRSVSASDVLAKVRSRVGQIFDSTTADEDTKRIAALGAVQFSYYSTQVVDDRIELTFVVVERNLVRAIVFTGNRIKAKVLTQKLDFKLGDYLDPVTVCAGVKTLTEYYLKKGYPFAKVSLDADKMSEGRAIYRIEEGPRVKISAVAFEGNKALKSKDLKKVIKTKKKKFMVLTKYYSVEGVDKDVAKLRSLYYQRGYLDSKIEPRAEFSEDKKKVRMVFVIDEGLAYQVGQVLITGNIQFDPNELRENLKLEISKTYNDKKAESDRKYLLQRYQELGYVEAAVEKKKLFVGPDKVDVEYVIVAGERFRIGRINITGNKETQDRVVRRILDEYDFKPGQWYNAHLAKQDGYLQKLVRRTAVTEAVAISPTGDTPGQKDAQVNITEGRTGMIMLGAGIASDSGVVGQLIFEQRNFDIKDKPKSLWEFITGKAYKGAGQTLRIAVEPGTEMSRYSISFTEPYFQDKPMSFDALASSYAHVRESYDEERIKGFVGFEKRYKNRWRRSIGIRAESVDVGDFEADTPTEVLDDRGTNSLFGVRLGTGKDMRDDRYNPTKGNSFNIGYEQVAGDHTFGVFDVVYRHYKTLHEDLAENKTVLAVKLLGATTVGEAPVFEKFYAGGTGRHGIRGFQYRGVSPRGKPPGAAPGFKGGDPIGSDWIAIANAEVTVPLGSETFSALLFVDSGMVDEGGYRAAAGVGLQILIPQWFGPVPMRFELAAPFMKDGEDDTQAFSFSVGRLF